MSAGAKRQLTFRQYGGRNNQREHISANTITTDQLIFQRKLIGNYTVEGKFTIAGDLVEVGGAGGEEGKVSLNGKYVDLSNNTSLYVPKSLSFAREVDNSVSSNVDFLRFLPVNDATSSSQTPTVLPEVLLCDKNAYAAWGATKSHQSALTIGTFGAKQLHLTSLLDDETPCDNVLADSSIASATVTANTALFDFGKTAAFAFRDKASSSLLASMQFLNDDELSANQRKVLLFDVAKSGAIAMFRGAPLFACGSSSSSNSDSAITAWTNSPFSQASSANALRRAAVFGDGSADDPDLCLFDSRGTASTPDGAAGCMGVSGNKMYLRVSAADAASSSDDTAAAVPRRAAILTDDQGVVNFGCVVDPDVDLRTGKGMMTTSVVFSQSLLALQGATAHVHLDASGGNRLANTIFVANCNADGDVAIVFDPSTNGPQSAGGSATFKHPIRVMSLLPESSSSSSSPMRVSPVPEATPSIPDPLFNNALEMITRGESLDTCVPIHGAPGRFLVGIIAMTNLYMLKIDSSYTSKLLEQQSTPAVFNVAVADDSGGTLFGKVDARTTGENSTLFRTLAFNRNSSGGGGGGGKLFLNIYSLETGAQQRLNRSNKALSIGTATDIFGEATSSSSWSAQRIVYCETDAWQFAALAVSSETSELCCTLFRIDNAESSSSPSLSTVFQKKVSIDIDVAAAVSWDAAGGSDMGWNARFTDSSILVSAAAGLVARFDWWSTATIGGEVAVTVAAAVESIGDGGGGDGGGQGEEDWMPLWMSPSTSLFWNRKWAAAATAPVVLRWSPEARHVERVALARVDADGTLQWFRQRWGTTTSISDRAPVFAASGADSVFLTGDKLLQCWLRVDNLRQVLEFDFNDAARRATSTSNPQPGLTVASDLFVHPDACIVGGGWTSGGLPRALALRTRDDAQPLQLGNAQELSVDSGAKIITVSENVDTLRIHANATEFAPSLSLSGGGGIGVRVVNDAMRVSRLLSTGNNVASVSGGAPARKQLHIGGGGPATPIDDASDNSDGTQVVIGAGPSDQVSLGIDAATTVTGDRTSVKHLLVSDSMNTATTCPTVLASSQITLGSAESSSPTATADVLSDIITLGSKSKNNSYLNVNARNVVVGHVDNYDTNRFTINATNIVIGNAENADNTTLILNAKDISLGSQNVTFSEGSVILQW